MKYYIIKNDFKGSGSPATLNAVLAERFDAANPMPPMSGYSWTKSKDLDIEFPSDLFLISKDCYYDFNYIGFWKGFVVSEQFKAFIDKYLLEYKKVNLITLNHEGKDISNKKYYFVYIPMKNRVDIIDYRSSEFVLDYSILKLRGLSEEDVKKDNNYFGNIKEYKRLIMKNTGNPDVFQVKDLIVQDLVCSPKFKDDIIQHKVSNLVFIDTHDMNLFNNYYL